MLYDQRCQALWRVLNLLALHKLCKLVVSFFVSAKLIFGLRRKVAFRIRVTHRFHGFFIKEPVSPWINSWVKPNTSYLQFPDTPKLDVSFKSFRPIGNIRRLIGVVKT